MERKRMIKWKNAFLALFILILIITLIISSINIIRWVIDSKNTKEEINIINEEVNVIEVEDTTKTEIINIETEKIEKENPYWDYIKMNLISVDFNELKQKNSETVGWLQVGGTNINYPFVQTQNNEFYLTHSFDKSYNKSGWVFMDYRNNKDEFNKNTIIYAHGRMNNTMFGTLRKVLTNGWLDNTNNHVIKLSTDQENTLWQVFSVYVIPTTNDYIQVNFTTNQEFLEFTNKLLNRSEFNFKTSINENDKILTLSTCYNDEKKTVLHAKLIKREKKGN